MAEEVTSVFTATLRPDGIWVYRFTDVTREAMDAWYETSVRHDMEYDARGEHLRRLILIDRLIMPTPYAIGRTREAAEKTPLTLRESNALVLTQSLTLRLIVMGVQRLPGQPGSIRVFLNEPDALEWLESRQKELES